MWLHVAAVLLTSFTTPMLHKECVRVTGQSVLSDKSVELVFGGQVAAVTEISEVGYRATFDVERVWKGSVPARVSLYVPYTQPEGPQFLLAQRRVVLARTVNDAHIRQVLAIPGSGAFLMAVSCSDPTVLSPDIERELGTSHPPQHVK